VAFIFRWSPGKARLNLAKHQVSFEEATTVFGDPLAISIIDDVHSFDEQRFITIGMSIRWRLILVSHSVAGDTMRLFSARTATRRERKSYEEGKQ